MFIYYTFLYINVYSFFKSVNLEWRKWSNLEADLPQHLPGATLTPWA